MTHRYHVLGLGASYGSLLAVKLLAGGHDVTLACLPAEAELINAEGVRVRIPARGRATLVEVDSRKLSGRLSAATPAQIDPHGFDLVALAMQEPQYRASGVRELLVSIGDARLPCMSIMNMPPPPFLARIPGVRVDEAVRRCYADAAVWEVLDPSLVTLCSPDAQAFRPPEEKVNVLQVRLPTNFKAAPFASEAHTAMLRAIAADIDTARFDAGERERLDLPVKLRVHDSLFVPLAKWSMLIAGNYRCVGDDAVVSIRDAVHGDVATSRAVYEWVARLCERLGARAQDLVPFDKYAAAAQLLAGPSSAARALAAGATDIERVDRLVQVLASRLDMQSEDVDRVVARVDRWLAENRRKAQGAAQPRTAGRPSLPGEAARR